jgi:soluble lytic murein transglycosylase-like protein
MKKKTNRRLLKLFLSAVLLIVLIYNPISARIMTVITAAAHGLDVDLFYNLVSTESSFFTLAYSRKQAIGLGQVRVQTAMYIYPDYIPGILWFPPTNLHISALYVKYLQNKYKSNSSLTLAAYNWGETNVDRKLITEKIVVNKDTDYRHLFINVPETYHYISKVLD